MDGVVFLLAGASVVHLEVGEIGSDVTRDAVPDVGGLGDYWIRCRSDYVAGRSSSARDQGAAEAASYSDGEKTRAFLAKTDAAENEEGKPRNSRGYK